MLRNYQDNVFINSPFDSAFKPIFDALVFVIQDAGFIARCALEISDGSQNRLQKILAIIAECRFGVRDLSRTELDSAHSLPRFNMPFELGLYVGCKWFGNKTQQAKSCLILDREPHRYQKFISDISGQEVYYHDNEPEQALGMVRNWLRTEPKRRAYQAREQYGNGTASSNSNCQAFARSSRFRSMNSPSRTTRTSLPNG